MNDTVSNHKVYSQEEMDKIIRGEELTNEWEVMDSCNRTLVVTKTQRRLVASCINKDDAIAICDVHNRLETKYKANQITEVKCDKCGKTTKDYSVVCNACGFDLVKEHIQEKLAIETDFIFVRNRLMNVIDRINEVLRHEKHG